MIFIDDKKVMRLYIANEIGSQHHTPPNFPLDTDVHLDRARSAVLRIKRRAVIQSAALAQQSAQVGRVGRSQVKREGRLILFLEGEDVVGRDSDGDRPPSG